MKFNINENVKVKLTDKGFEIDKLHWDRLTLGKFEYRPPKVDEDGYTKFQLWELMSIFGPHVYNGCEIPFETEIILVESNI